MCNRNHSVTMTTGGRPDKLITWRAAADRRHLSRQQRVSDRGRHQGALRVCHVIRSLLRESDILFKVNSYFSHGQSLLSQWWIATSDKVELILGRDKLLEVEGFDVTSATLDTSVRYHKIVANRHCNIRNRMSVISTISIVMISIDNVIDCT